jgi:DeoR/GlpR family transcriptional regulator of sugar metabolism
VSRKNLSVVNLVAPFSQVDKAIIGTPGLSLKGLTADDTDTVQQLEFLAKRAKNIIILADSTKIGRDCAYPTRSMRMIRLDISHQKSYTLVTDSDGKGAPERDHVLSRLEEIGFRVIQV